MDRRLFLGSILGLALQSTAARAQSQQPGVTQFDPNPSFVYVQMVVVGYVSILSDDTSLLKGFRRLEDELISWEPIKQFVVEGDRSAVTTRAKQALLEQAQRSVVDMLVGIKKHGY